VFTNILLADEINRASPRTQSALLEVMAEQQVSVEGRTQRVDELFFVIATQNPVEFPVRTRPKRRWTASRCASLGYVMPTRGGGARAQDLGTRWRDRGGAARRSSR
jgi:MoxR-like ATPase